MLTRHTATGGETTCVSGATCTALNDCRFLFLFSTRLLFDLGVLDYSQCLPGSGGSPPTTTGMPTPTSTTDTEVPTPTTTTGTVVPTPTTTTTEVPTPTATGSPGAGGIPFLGGVNLAGYDFSVVCLPLYA